VLLYYSNPSIEEVKRKPKIKWNNTNWAYIISNASKNDVEYILCKNLCKLKSRNLPRTVLHKLINIMRICELQLVKLRLSMQLLHDSLSEHGIPFIVFKTMAPYNYVMCDIDVLVRSEDYTQAQQNLSKARLTRAKRMSRGTSFTGNDILLIDLHENLCWDSIGRGGSGPQIVDIESIWNRKVTLKVNDVEIFIPSPEDEILILCAHSIFQHHYVTLGDFFYIFELLKRHKIDWEYLLNSPRQYNWGLIFYLLLRILSSRYEILYEANIVPQSISLNNIAKRYKFPKFEEVRGYNVVYTFSPHFTFAAIAYKSYFDLMKSPKIEKVLKDGLLNLAGFWITMYRLWRYHYSGRLAFNPDWLAKHLNMIEYPG